MIQKPCFSVLIPVLNRRHDIQAAIDSCLSQSVGDFEIIIVDNGSTDGTYEFCQGLTNPRIRLFRRDEKGITFARNKGIREANGDWIIYLDSDNRFIDGTMFARIEEELRKYPDLIGLLTHTRYESGKPASSSSIHSGLITFQDYLTACKGEFIPVVRTEWLKRHLYPEIPGATTDFPYCVWLELVQTNKTAIAPLVSQIYTTGAAGRSSGSSVDPGKARGFASYYKLVLERFGERIWQVNKPLYLACLWRLVFYNQVCRAFSEPELKQFRFYLPFKALRLIPGRIVEKGIETYKHFVRGD